MKVRDLITFMSAEDPEAEVLFLDSVFTETRVQKIQYGTYSVVDLPGAPQEFIGFLSDDRGSLEPVPVARAVLLS